MKDFINSFFIFGAKYLYIAIIGVAFFYFLKQPKDIKKQIIILGAMALPVIYLIAKIIGFFYYDPRPFVVDNFTPLVPHAPDNGFPSDHTLLSAGMASVLYPFNKKISAVLWIFTLAIGFSRVYVGIHHPVDILGSAIISVIFTALIFQFIKVLSSKWSPLDFFD